MDVSGQVVVVTGGGQGIGEALARRFDAEGARAVVVADIDGANAQAVAADLGTNSLGMAVDVTDEAQIVALLDRTEETFGPIGLCCGNAGIAVPGGPEVDDAAWRASLDVNVMAHVWTARHLVPRFAERGGGWYLMTVSAAGLLTQLGSAPYSVTKHAALALAEWLAITYGDQGLRVAALCPQAVRTAMTAGVEGGGVAGVDGMIEPADVAEAVVAGLAAEQFLILPHPEVREYVQRKAADHDRWIGGMQRLQARYGTLL